MPSTLAWLDNSREDQQRMRELLRMFEETESRDELGLGQVRDAFSDLLFPGTSTLHTRAKYLLLVPWCYKKAEQRRGRVEDEVSRYEQRIIKTLKDTSQGVIGGRVGPKVKTLPSSIYWHALREYSIRLTDEPATRILTPEAEEFTDREPDMWHPTVPDLPPGFPYEIPGGLDLLKHEAEWLRERIMQGASGSLLAHLVQPGNRPGNSEVPWRDTAALSTAAKPKDDLEHAELFSLVIQGAKLLYNLMIAETYEKAGYTKQLEPVDRYRALLGEWTEDLQSEHRLDHWDREAMWWRVTQINPRIGTNYASKAFISEWLHLALSTSELTDDYQARSLIRKRETSIKKKQSRLTNDALLRTWSGASGSARFTYRWRQVKNVLNDIHNGADADAAA